MSDFYEDYYGENDKKVGLTKEEIELIEPLIWKEVNQLERTAREVRDTIGYYAAESYYKKISKLKDILRKF